MSNKSKQWCIDGTACVSIDAARIAFNMSAPFFSLRYLFWNRVTGVYVIQTYKCAVPLCINNFTHSIEKVLKGTSIFDTFCHYLKITCDKRKRERKKNHVKCAYKQYSWDFHFKRWSCTQRVMCVECSNFKWNKPHISYIANIVCNFKCVVHITRMHACKMPHGNGNTNANKLIMKNREEERGREKKVSNIKCISSSKHHCHNAHKIARIQRLMTCKTCIYAAQHIFRQFFFRQFFPRPTYPAEAPIRNAIDAESCTIRYKQGGWPVFVVFFTH